MNTLSPELQVFINDDPKPIPSSSDTTSETATIASNESEPSSEEDTSPKSSTKSRRSVSTQARGKLQVPETWKVPITTKLEYSTMQALRRAYLEQKLNHATPDTQQRIVEVAVRDWLRRHGFFDE
jgi:hypothetical protein